MNKTIFAALLSSILLMTACNTPIPNQEQRLTNKDTLSVRMDESMSEKKYDVTLMDNKKDPICGMPVTAGISDTAHYKNKILGFCSPECKAEFKKNSVAAIAAAELK